MKLLKLLNKSRTFNELFSIPWEFFYGKKCNKCDNGLTILLLNAVCHGFGDVIFCVKLAKYLERWYNATVLIATPMPNGFVEVGGMNKKQIYFLKGERGQQCRRFTRLAIYDYDGKIEKPLPNADLIFVAPLQSDFYIDYSDVKAIIPYSNRFNTFFFSEYNDELSKKHDFPTGVGNNRMGLFLTNEKIGPRLPQVGAVPYAMSYIADVDETNDTVCFLSYMELVVKKYLYNYSAFSIVVPEWLAKRILINKELWKKTKRIFNKYKIGTVYVVLKNKSPTRGESIKVYKIYKSKNSGTIYIRGDIYPLQRSEMLRLMKYSVPDLLLTGDQSITDGFSCCSNKNIHYQRVDWKRNFALELSKEIPDKYLRSNKTSCGNIISINRKMNYKKFLKKWDFRKLGRKKLDAVILSVNSKDKTLIKFKEYCLSSKSLASVKRKMKKIETL